MSTVQFLGTHTGGTKQSAPEVDTTRDNLKIFLTRLGDRHSRFCNNCRTLIAESLDFLEQNKKAGSVTDQGVTPAVAPEDDRSYAKLQQSK